MTLQIYTVKDCLTRATTQHMAVEIAKRCPWLRVELIHLDEPGSSAPPEVFSVPTYVLDDKIVALGNPYLEHLEALIWRSKCQ